uniref:Uncharacterized protein n=1 Tax=Arundo donax TaxID=35708 RepID=A0A0A9FPY2_ARUDO
MNIPMPISRKTSSCISVVIATASYKQSTPHRYCNFYI